MRTALIALLLLAGCTATTATRTGTASYHPLTSESAVAVYAREADVKTPFEVIGLVYHVDPGKFQRVGLEEAIGHLKEQARTLGADGVIIDQVTPSRAGFDSIGIVVLARAIRAAPMHAVD